MEDKLEVRKTIEDLGRETLSIEGLNENDDFFNNGATSLTVVELQVKVEKKLDLSVPTSELMRRPSLAGWIDTYENAAAHSA